VRYSAFHTIGVHNVRKEEPKSARGGKTEEERGGGETHKLEAREAGEGVVWSGEDVAKTTTDVTEVL